MQFAFENTFYFYNLCQIECMLAKKKTVSKQLFGYCLTLFSSLHVLEGEVISKKVTVLEEEK